MNLQEKWGVLLREDHHKPLSCSLHMYDIIVGEDEDDNLEEMDGHINDQTDLGSGEDDDDDEVIHRQQSMYWKSQEALLQEILEQYHTSGAKLREEIGKHIETATGEPFGYCSTHKLESCAKCLRRQLVDLLCSKGFEATLRTSTWPRTQSIPGGKHEYVEVIAKTHAKKKKTTFLIEIGFRDEFKMPKACDEYEKLIAQLPATFIGKPEHLNGVIRAMCDAAKRSTAQKKIHMGPWRHRSFMQMKWSASDQRRVVQHSDEKYTDRAPPDMHATAVRVA